MTARSPSSDCFQWWLVRSHDTICEVVVVVVVVDQRPRLLFVEALERIFCYNIPEGTAAERWTSTQRGAGSDEHRNTHNKRRNSDPQSSNKCHSGIEQQRHQRWVTTNCRKQPTACLVSRE